MSITAVSQSVSNLPPPAERKPLVTRKFTKPGQDVWASVEWCHRDSQILDFSGKVHFELKAVEVPVTWSQTALNIVASKYFRRGEHAEKSVRQIISRVVTTITEWGNADGYFESSTERETFRDELTYLLLNQHAAFNSPVWFNVGVQEQPQCSACFILSVDDNLDSILSLQALEARLFKYGSGSGSNLSTIRSTKEKLSGGGTPSGPVSFMRGFDAWAGIIKSGGKTRRAAKMQMLNVDHPDILEFINCKQKEEKRVRALIEAGYSSSFGESGSAYDFAAFQNANLSVRLTDEFMQAEGEGKTYWTKRVLDGKACEELSAPEVLKAIAEGTHACGDPGVQFDTTINKWHTCPNSGRINGSNPCSEYMHVDNSACNLSSINLMKYFSEEGEFDSDGFKHAVSLLITAQDILVDRSSYPSDAIRKNARRFRQLGLGYANLGAVLMTLGKGYDSDEGRGWAGAITAMMTGEAYRQSTKLAQRKGAFEGYSKNRNAMLRVIRAHRDALKQLSHVDDGLLEEVRSLWDEVVDSGEEHGFRNSQATVLAPTGTISFMMDCDTTGIEPDIALVKYKQLAGGGALKLVNKSVERALTNLGYAEDVKKKILLHIENEGTIEGTPLLKESDLPVFDCALKPLKGSRNIHYLGHLKMMAATQPYLSGAISKTVNLSNEVTVDEIAEVYRTAWKLGLKAVALYRDGSKSYQPLNIAKKSSKTAEKAELPRRRKLPTERPSLTHKFSVGGVEGYVTVGLFDDGTPGEIFIVVAKEGSTLSGIMDSFATAISIALQYGVPMADLVRKFAHTRFEPSGFTGNPSIPMAKSLIDYIFKWLGQKFLSPELKEAMGVQSKDEKESPSVRPALLGGVKIKESKGDIANFVSLEDSPPCTVCGSGLMVRQGACYVCLNCGSQGGCG